MAKLSATVVSSWCYFLGYRKTFTNVTLSQCRVFRSFGREGSCFCQTRIDGGSAAVSWSMSKEIVGLRHIAKTLGVSTSTVSLAMRGSNKVSEATRERVISEVKKVGYAPNAKLNRLFREVRESNRVEFDSCLAVVVDGFDEKVSEGWETLLAAIRRRGSEYGFRTDVFRMDSGALTASRLGSMLYFRGIQGVVYVNLGDEEVECPETFSDFFCISVGNVREASGPSVSLNRFEALKQLLERGRRLGYQRPALFFEASQSESNILYKSSYLGWCEQRIGLDRAIPHFVFSESMTDNFREWIRKESPDLIVAIRPGKGFDRLASAYSNGELSSMKQPMMVVMEDWVCRGNHAGIRVDFASLGETAVEWLAESMELDKVGRGDSSRIQILDGCWTNEVLFLPKEPRADLLPVG